eukprot:scaffold192381_cov18-Tisochrysis_lutea.AAC.2
MQALEKGLLHFLVAHTCDNIVCTPGAQIDSVLNTRVCQVRTSSVGCKASLCCVTQDVPGAHLERWLQSFSLLCYSGCARSACVRTLSVGCKASLCCVTQDVPRAHLLVCQVRTSSVGCKASLTCVTQDVPRAHVLVCQVSAASEGCMQLSLAAELLLCCFGVAFFGALSWSAPFFPPIPLLVLLNW